MKNKEKKSTKEFLIDLISCIKEDYSIHSKLDILPKKVFPLASLRHMYPSIFSKSTVTFYKGIHEQYDLPTDLLKRIIELSEPIEHTSYKEQKDDLINSINKIIYDDFSPSSMTDIESISQITGISFEEIEAATGISVKDQRLKKWEEHSPNQIAELNSILYLYKHRIGA